MSIHRDTLLARQLLDQEKTYTNQGDYQSALDVVEKAQVLYAKHKLWEESIQCAIDLSKLADQFTAELKARYANLAILLAQQHLPDGHPLLAAAFRQKAEYFMMTGLLDSANYYLNVAIPFFKKNNQWVDLGWSEIFLSIIYLQQHQLDTCEIHLQSVQNLLAEQTLEETDKTELRSTLLSLFGSMYQLQGDYDKAIKNTQASLAFTIEQMKSSEIDSSLLFTQYNNLGVFHQIKGDYQRALDNFMQATYTYKGAAKDSRLLNNIGELLHLQQKYTEAKDYALRSLQLTHYRTGQIKTKLNALNNLARIFTKMELLDSALLFCQQANALPTDYRKHITKGLMGDILIKKGQVFQAIDHLDDALSFYKNDAAVFGKNPFFISRLYGLKGDAYLLNQDQHTALNFYQKALTSNHKTFKDSLNHQSNPPLTGIYDPIFFFKAIHGKAKALALGNTPAQQKKALETYQLTMQWADTLQASYSSETTQLNWSRQFKQIQEESITLAYQLYQSTQDFQYVNLAFTFSEKSKNVILLEMLKASEGKYKAGIPADLIQQEKDLNLNIAFYEKAIRKAKQKGDNTKTALYQNYLSTSRLNLNSLKEQIALDYPKFQAWKSGDQIISLATVQNQLVDANSAFLEYFLGDHTAYAFVITKHEATLLKLAKPKQIKNSVIGFRQVLLDLPLFEKNAKTAFQQYSKTSAAVYQHILQPIFSTLSTNISQLTIVPDGALNAIPFEVLVKTETTPVNIDFALLPYLLYDYQIQYAYSANLLLKNETRQDQLSPNIQCLALAPAYQDSKNIAQRGNLSKLRNSAGYLEGTAKEIQQIAQFFEGQFDFSSSATEQKFKQSASDFGILHLAMHGVVDLDNANFNHLIFPQTINTVKDAEDNLLHHYEIANMDLQAQLVVLSACETGVGKYEKGEGVFSLARSFMYAGVPSVVMSLWKVSDASTSQLMPYFYENLANGSAKDAALHKAKLRFLKEANLEFRHPYYWSAFVVMGDAQKINTENSNIIWWGLGMLFLALLGWWLWNRRKT